MPKKKIHYYSVGKDSPFLKWFNKLDLRSQVIVDKYIQKVAEGNKIKNLRHLGDGVTEIKIYYGPGLRVYFSEDGNMILLLLLGGDKRSQNRDIKKAKEYRSDYGKTK